MPFEATETKNSRFGNRVRMSPEEALDVMHALRDELEVRPGRGGRGGARWGEGRAPVAGVGHGGGKGRVLAAGVGQKGLRVARAGAGIHTVGCFALSPLVTGVCLPLPPLHQSTASNHAFALSTAPLCRSQLLRIVADQVRKRERLKKQLLKIWRAQKLGLVGWGGGIQELGLML